MGMSMFTFCLLVFPFLVTFSVMCYNVLCDKYCTRQIYGYCPSWALDWEYRKTAILKEILHYQADILGLQVMYKHSFCRNCCVLLTFSIITNTCISYQPTEPSASVKSTGRILALYTVFVKCVNRETTCSLGHAQVLK